MASPASVHVDGPQELEASQVQSQTHAQENEECPVQGCGQRLGPRGFILGHIRAKHKGCQIREEWFLERKFEKCQDCSDWFVTLNRHRASSCLRQQPIASSREREPEGDIDSSDAVADNQVAVQEVFDDNGARFVANQPEGGGGFAVPVQVLDREDFMSIDLDDKMFWGCKNLMKSMPASLRAAYTNVLYGLFKKISEHPEDVGAWKAWLVMPALCFYPAGKGGAAGLNVLRARLNAFSKGKIASLLDGFRVWVSAVSMRASPSTRKSDTKIAAAAFFKLQKGELGKCMRMLGPSVPLGDSRTEQALILETLRSKHPPRKADIVVPVNIFRSVDADEEEDPDQLVIKKEFLVECMRGMPKGSAPGVSGWTGEMISPILSDERCLDAFLSVVNLIGQGKIPDAVKSFFTASRLVPIGKPSQILSERVNAQGEVEVQSIDVRPIAVGDAIRRLVARTVCAQYKQRWKEFFSPLQLGVSVPAGAEIAFRSVQATLQANPGWFAVALDLSNAFNEVQRSVFFEELRIHFPALVPFVSSMYTNPAELLVSFADEKLTLQSCEGTQQGDPMGPFLFCLGLHRVLRKVASETVGLDPNSGLLAAYIDDMVVVGPLGVVSNVVGRINEDLPSVGLALRPGKCKIFGSSLEDQSFNDLLSIERQRGSAVSVGRSFDVISLFKTSSVGFSLLGVPLGNDDFVKSGCLALIADIEDKVASLSKLDSWQARFLLFRMCVIPVANYMARLTEPRLFKPTAVEVDRISHDFVQMIAGVQDMNDGTWSQVCLPLRLGGLGLRHCETTLDAAYLGSWGMCYGVLREMPCIRNFMGNMDRWPSISCLKALTNSYESLSVYLKPRTSAEPRVRWKEAGKSNIGIGAQGQVQPETDSRLNSARIQLNALGRVKWVEGVTNFLSQYGGRKLQRIFTKEIEDELLFRVWSRAPDTDKARILSASGPGAAGWLTAIPYAASLAMSNEDFRGAVLYRLGLPLPACVFASKCVCGGDMDQRGYHAIGCAKDGHWFVRHNGIRDTMVRLLRDAGFQVGLEVMGAFGPEAKGRRPDFAVNRFVDGESLLGDVSVTSVINKQGEQINCKASKEPSRGTSDTRGLACLAREQKKNGLYSSDALKSEKVFVPLVFETFGYMGKPVLQLINKMAVHASQDPNKRNGKSEGDFIQAFRLAAVQKLSVCLQKGNVRCIVAKAVFADHPGLGIGSFRRGQVMGSGVLQLDRVRGSVVRVSAEELDIGLSDIDVNDVFAG